MPSPVKGTGGWREAESSLSRKALRFGIRHENITTKQYEKGQSARARRECWLGIGPGGCEQLEGLAFEPAVEDKQTFSQVCQSEKWPSPKSNSVNDMM